MRERLDFYIDGTQVASGVALSNGRATYSTSTLSLGAHTVAAVYTSDSSNFLGSDNLAMPFTLELDPLPDSVRSEVQQLAGEVGLSSSDLSRPVAALAPLDRLRLRFGRAVALNPRLLLAEHPNASVPAADVTAFAADYRQVVTRRGIASLTLTADRAFAAAVADEVLTLQPATGELKPASFWRRRLS